MSTLDAQLEQPPVLYFGRGEARPVNPTLVGQGIRDLWRNFTSKGDLRYGSVLEQLMIWAASADEAQLSRLPINVREEAQHLHEFASQYQVILNDFSQQLKLQTNVIAKTASERMAIREKIGVKAVFNQRLASEFDVLAREPAGSIRRKNAAAFIDIARTLARMNIPLGTEATMAIAGAKAQTAVTGLLEKQGCTVVSPDPDKPREVYDLDVYAKADFIAIFPDWKDIFLIDAKSRNRITVDDTQMGRHIGETIETNSLVLFLRQMEVVGDIKKKFTNLSPQTTFRHFQVLLPTHDDAVGTFGDALDPALSRDILAGLNIR